MRLGKKILIVFAVIELFWRNKIMKKLTAIFLVLSMVLTLAGCAGTTVVVGNCTCPPGAHDTVETPTEAPAETPTEGEPAPGSELLKTGLAVIANISGSAAAAAEENGKADYDITLAAVTVDENGIIRDCVIDSVGTSVAFDAAGLPVDFDAAKSILTKNELGDSYGMKAYGGAAYEWFEQAAALADFAVGKTVEEFKGGYAGDVDLATTATIYLGGYVAAVEKAVANAQALGAKAGDELKLSVINTMDASAAQEAGGAAELSVDVAAVTMAGDVITSCYIDALQAQVEFDGSGALITDTSVAPQTKNELGEAYGMKAWAGAKFKWNEQAANFAAYVTGKTAADVAGIAINEATKPADGTDLAASVTISIGGFQALIEKVAPVSDEAAALKTGLAVIASAAESKSAEGETNGEAKYDVTVAAVTVDENGVIQSCAIDSIGTSVAFDAAGLLVDFDPAAAVLTKTELGDAYGMKAYAGAKYEWYEQAQALADFAVGKTVEELRAGAVNEAGKAADADLATTATIYLGGYVDAIEKAVANAQALGAKEGDELKLAIISKLDAGPGQDTGGAAELSVDVAAVTMAGDVITSCYIDALQAQVEFDGAGQITTDLAALFQTKNELGEAYGMKAWAGAKFEWNEQAANFAAYVTGKTAADVAGIAINEATKPADGTDLAASVTISIGGFQALIEKAAA